MTTDSIFAIIQLPLAAITALLYGLQFKRHGPVRINRLNWRKVWREWLRSVIWLLIAAVSISMTGWRAATISDVISPEYRAAGGMAVQTLYQIVVLIAYVALRDHSGSKQ